MLSKGQLQLVHMAARGAGLSEGRRHLLLAKYKQRGGGQPVTSSRQLTLDQMEDFLAICESLGWRHPGKSADFYQQKLARYADPHRCGLSVAQKEAIAHLAGDLGMTDDQIDKFVRRMTGDTPLVMLTNFQGCKVIEGLKAVLSRRDKKEYKTVADVAEQYETDQGF